MGVNSDVLDDNAALCPNIKKNKPRCYLASGKCWTSPPLHLTPCWGVKPLSLLLRGPNWPNTGGGLAVASLYCQSVLEVWRGRRSVPAACLPVCPPSTLRGCLDFLQPSVSRQSTRVSVFVWPAVCPVCVLFVFHVYVFAGPASLCLPP